MKMVKNHVPDFQLQIVGSFGSTAPKAFIVTLSEDPKVQDLDPHFGGDYSSYLKNKISSELSHHVKLAGIVSHEETANKFRDADVFIFPSVWNEPFGMPVIEAMACNVPVVATKSGGITELVEDGETGLLVERGNAEQLSEAVIRLLENKQLRNTMGKAGRLRALENFTWDIAARNLLELYQSLS